MRRENFFLSLQGYGGSISEEDTPIKRVGNTIRQYPVCLSVSVSDTLDQDRGARWLPSRSVDYLIGTTELPLWPIKGQASTIQR
jgi:hypothetical protein